MVTAVNPNVVDGFVNLLGGMSGGLAPTLIPETTYARGINVSTRGGLVHTRPGFMKLSALPNGKFQGAGRWSMNSGDRVVYVVAGAVYAYSPETNVNTQIFSGTTDPVTGAPIPVTLTSDRCYICQVDRWCVVQDGTSRPVVLVEDATTGLPTLYGRDAPLVCLVPGTVMAYAHQRLHYVPTLVPMMTPDPDAFPDVVPTLSTESGKMVFVSSDVRDITHPEYVFRMSEHRLLAQGGGIALPQEMGFITGMCAFRNAATGSGVGALVVFAREGMSAFAVNSPRTQWKTVDLGQVLFYGPGTVSHNSIVPVNDDIMYRGVDGVRFVRYSKTEAGGGSGTLSNNPKSREVTPWMTESETSLPYVSSAFADNRATMTAQGEVLADGSIGFKGLISLDVSQAATISEVDPPGWDGLFTGFKFLQVMGMRYAGRMETHAIVRSGDNTFYARLSEDATTDSGTPIQSMLVTRAMNFGNLVDLKELQYVDATLSDLTETVDIAVYFRPSSYPVWSELGSKIINVPGGSPQVRRRVRFALDISTIGCNLITGERLHTGSEFQFALVWQGHCQIDKFRAAAMLRLEAPPGCIADNAENMELPTDLGLSDYEYEVLW